MRRFICPTAVMLLLLPVLAGAETVRLATLDWEPYAGRTLRDGGFTAEIVTEAFRRAGYQVKIDFLPWDRAVEEAGKGNYDGVFPEYYSRERSRDFVYSRIISGSRIVFYRPSSSPVPYRTLKDLVPYRIGTVRGYIVADEFDNAAYLKKVEADGDEENLRRLSGGELDIIVIDKLVARHLLKARVPEAEGKLVSMEPPLAIHNLFVILPRKNPASEKRAREFNRAFESMEKDGTVKAIMAGSGLIE